MKHKAFTIIEILIVVAIVVIVAGIAIVAYSNAEPVFELNGAADQIVSALNLAKQRAISRTDNTAYWQVEFSYLGDNTKFRFMAYNADGSEHPYGDTGVFTLPQGITIDFSSTDFGGGIVWPAEFISTPPNTDIDFSGSDAIRFLPVGKAVSGTGNDFNVGYLFLKNSKNPPNYKLIVITGLTGRIKAYTLTDDRLSLQ